MTKTTWGGKYKTKAAAEKEAAKFFDRDVKWKVLPDGKGFRVWVWG